MYHKKIQLLWNAYYLPTHYWGTWNDHSYVHIRLWIIAPKLLSHHSHRCHLFFNCLNYFTFPEQIHAFPSALTPSPAFWPLKLCLLKAFPKYGISPLKSFLISIHPSSLNHPTVFIISVSQFSLIFCPLACWFQSYSMSVTWLMWCLVNQLSKETSELCPICCYVDFFLVELIIRSIL